MDVVSFFYAVEHVVGTPWAIVALLFSVGIGFGALIVLPILIGLHLPGLLLRFAFRATAATLVVWIIFAMSLPS